MPGPVAAVWLVVLALTLGMVWLSPSTPRRRPGPSWFDLLPYMTVSKKARGRAQQKRRTHRG